MLGDSTVFGAGGSSADAGGAGGVGPNSVDDERGGRGEEGDRNSGGNRWPRQETLSLLKIRSDMDVAFRDGSVKGPLWEEISRKLGELGYNRSAKKCKEKFENLYKYHRRTKEGRSGKPDGKSYRFFDQLDALDNLPSMPSSSITSSKTQAALQATPLSVNSTVETTMATTTVVAHVTVPSTTMATIPMAMSRGIVNPSMNLAVSSYPLLPLTNPTNLAPSMANPTYPTPLPPPPATIPITAFQRNPTEMLSNSSSSSTSDEELEGRRRRKRKWKDFFERLMKEVIDKQEDLQKRFMEAIDRREHDRMVREEAWRSQEMERINRERQISAQERSMAAAKDAAVMTFLQKIAEQHNLSQALNNIYHSQPPPPAPPKMQQQPSRAPSPPPPQANPRPFLQPQQKQASVTPPQQQLSQPVTANVVSSLELADNSNQNFLAASSSRWPKVEVDALIKLRSSLDPMYQENGPKGPMWEEISTSMRKLGYNRNAKRCKEKWENINKYYKKVKDSNKKRSEDSKTCPYYHLLDALYKEKNMFDHSTTGNNQLKPESLMSSGAPMIVRPEQQWPPQQDMRLKSTEPGQEPEPEVTMESEPMEGNHEDDDEYDEDEEGGCNFEIVVSKPASTGAA